MDLDTFYRRIVLLQLATRLHDSVFLKKESGVVSEHPIYYKAQVDMGLFVVEGYVMPADSSEEDLTGYTEEIDPIEDFEQRQIVWFTARRWVGAKNSMTRGWALLHGEHGQKFNVHTEVAGGEAMCFSCAIHVDALDRLQSEEAYYTQRTGYKPRGPFDFVAAGGGAFPSGMVATVVGQGGGQGMGGGMSSFGPITAGGGGGGIIGGDGQVKTGTYTLSSPGNNVPRWDDEPMSDDRTMKAMPMTGINVSGWKPPMITELPRHQRSHNFLLVSGAETVRMVIEGLSAETMPEQASLAMAENGLQFKEYVKGEGNDHDTVYFVLKKQPNPSVMPSPLAASLMNDDVQRVQRQLEGFAKGDKPFSVEPNHSDIAERNAAPDPALQDPITLWSGRFVQDNMPGADGGGSGSKVSITTDDPPKDEPPEGTTPTGA